MFIQKLQKRKLPKIIALARHTAHKAKRNIPWMVGQILPKHCLHMTFYVINL